METTPAIQDYLGAIYDLTGRRLGNVVSGTLEPGRYQLPWTAVSESGARLPAGLYFAHFTASGMTQVARLILLP